ncbi:BcepNY3gp56 [Burkholderia phage BcepNY3]|uniref:Gp57 n=3 Tax=Naesvirus TaxID=2733115 RepID=Q6UIX4_9CAUD|nr:gp55 [Burkholderia phage Bcep781]NP_944366.1 gp57 [Burkholderia phage Bcep1]YP_001294894.1 BcepNY3gp56 [Burkholderia phage BcepNY3]AAN38054.1 gp55 [Burkholderia phage Bcep781]AAQ73404.1 gp57 [Burkholderia phage Bcep1]ABR10591.1 BcepNY3gp56 [Burkholderia phage BcepNY3]
MNAIDALGEAIEQALEECPTNEVLAFLTGAFVGLITELARRHGADASQDIKIDGGKNRDITIHAAKAA